MSLALNVIKSHESLTRSKGKGLESLPPSSTIADLWIEANELLRAQNEELVIAYEDILASEASGSASNIRNWSSLSGKEREDALVELIEKQTQLQTQM